jgi:hypothetical protein
MKLSHLGLALCALAVPGTAAAEPPYNPLPAERVFSGPGFGKGKPVVIDTFGGAETVFRALGTAGSQARPTRWRMELNVAIHDPARDDQDVLLAQLYKGKKKLGAPTVCEWVRTLGQSDKFNLGGYAVQQFRCEEKDRGEENWAELHDTSGPHELRLSMKRVLAGTVDQDFVTLEVEPIELKQGAQNSPTKVWSTNHDRKMPVSLAWEKPLGLFLGGRLDGFAEEATMALHGASDVFGSALVIGSWFKRDKSRERPTMTCFHEGQKLGTKPIEGRAEETFEHWTYTPAGQVKARWEHVQFDLSRAMIMMRRKADRPLMYKPEPVWMAELPGAYRCVVIEAGNVVKEFTFEVADGAVKAPACQASSINTIRGVTLLTTKTTSTGDAEWDKKRGASRAFEGASAWAPGCPPTP